MGDGVYLEGDGPNTIGKSTIAANVGNGLTIGGGRVKLVDTILWGNGLDISFWNIWATAELERCVYGGRHLEQIDYLTAEGRFIATDCWMADPVFGPDFTLSEESPYAAMAEKPGWEKTGTAKDFAHIYVSAEGNDTTGDGTSAAPYRTLTKAVSVATDNLVIHLGAGTYDVEAGELFPVCLTKKSLLRIIGEGDGRTIISGAGCQKDLLRFQQVTDLKLSGIAFTGARIVGKELNECYSAAAHADRCGGVVVSGCRFEDNISDVNTYDGYGCGAGMGFKQSSALIEDCVFSKNSTKNGRMVSGGGIGAYRGTLDMVGCTIVSNRVVNSGWGARGGGVAGDGIVAGSLRNCLVVGNNSAANDWGNGVHFICRRDSRIAGVPFAHIENCTILDNTHSEGHKVGVFSNCSIVNSIIRGHIDDIAETPVSVTYCNISDGSFADQLGVQSADPCFRKPLAGDYTLKGSSPCIDSGVVEPWMAASTDLLGNKRLVGKKPDLGCYETPLAKATMLILR